MKEDEFTKLFNYIQEMRSDLQTQLDTKSDKSDIDRILSAIDNLAEANSRDEIERAVQDSQLNRIEERTEGLEEHVGDHEERIGRLERRAA